MIAKKSTAPADAEVPGTKEDEAGAAWTRVGGKQSKPVPVNAPTESKYLRGNLSSATPLTVNGRFRPLPVQPLAGPLTVRCWNQGGNWQILCEDEGDVIEALEGLGATQTKPMDEKKWGWRPAFYKDRYCSYRTEMVTVEATI